MPQELQTKLLNIIKIVQTNRVSECSALRYRLYYIFGSLSRQVTRDVDLDQGEYVERTDEIRRG